jgi:hypothetical protein
MSEQTDDRSTDAAAPPVTRPGEFTRAPIDLHRRAGLTVRLCDAFCDPLAAAGALLVIIPSCGGKPYLLRGGLLAGLGRGDLVGAASAGWPTSGCASPRRHARKLARRPPAPRGSSTCATRPTNRRAGEPGRPLDVWLCRFHSFQGMSSVQSAHRALEVSTGRASERHWRMARIAFRK